MEAINITLYGKNIRVFADVIKNLQIRRVSWIIHVASKCNKYPLGEGGQRRSDAHKKQWCEDSRERFEDADHENWRDEATSQGTVAAPKSRKRQGTDPPEPLQEVSPGNTLIWAQCTMLILDFWPSKPMRGKKKKLWEDKFLLF